jgi:hypothetical protein
MVVTATAKTAETVLRGMAEFPIDSGILAPARLTKINHGTAGLGSLPRPCAVVASGIAAGAAGGVGGSGAEQGRYTEREGGGFESDRHLLDPSSGVNGKRHEIARRERVRIR